MVTAASVGGALWSVSRRRGPAGFLDQGSALGMEYAPDLSRVYSRAAYEPVVVSAAPYRVVAERARASVTPVRLRAIEIDAVVDDIYHRDGEVVLVGEEDGMLVGFAHRYLVDMRYPTNDLHSDGLFGSAEWGEHALVLDGRRYPLRQRAAHERPSSGDERITWEAVGEHDAAILYIPPSLRAFAQLPSLGVPEPARAIREALKNSASLFGLDFVLVSSEAFDDLVQGARAKRLTLPVFFAGVALGALYFAPLLGQLGAAALISESSLGQLGRQVVAKALPSAVRLIQQCASKDGLRTVGGEVLELLGVEWPEDARGLGMIATFVDAMLEGSEGQFVAHSGRGVEGGQLFFPEEQLNLNVELLGRGLARLDLSELDVLREYPELVEAAFIAMDAGRNLAAKWREDEGYRETVETLQRG